MKDIKRIPGRDAEDTAAMPEWLDRATEESICRGKFPLRGILDNSLYYPASGLDGDPVAHLAGRTYSFVYADYSLDRREIREHGCRGYCRLGIRNLRERDLFPEGLQQCRFSPAGGRQPRNAGFRKPFFALWTVWTRLEQFDASHGPERFSWLFICEEGVGVFQGLYVNNHVAPKYLAIIQPGTGLGGNWTDFGAPHDILARTVMANPAGRPDFLLHGGIGGKQHYEESCWPEYGDFVRFLVDIEGRTVGLWKCRSEAHEKNPGAMKRTKSQFSRLLELDTAIRARRYPNCLTFAQDWEVSQKTVQRDVDFLRDQLGAPIEYDRERKGFYYADLNWFLPSLSLSEGDLLALLVGSKALEAYRGTPIAKDLERVFAKLADMLPDKISLRPELIFNRFTFTSPPSKPIDEKIWTVLVRGVLHQRSIKITYQAMEAKEAKERTIDPYHMANLAGEWYVFAYCHRSKQLIQFAIPRIRKAAIQEESFAIPADFDMQKLLSQTFGRFAVPYGKVHTVRLVFDKEIAPWVIERQWHPKQKIKKRKNGNIELSFEAAGLFEVFRWVLAWGHYCNVLGPKELKDWVKKEAQLMNQKK